MDLRFNTSLAEGYKSHSQIARVLTEDWLAHNIPHVIQGGDFPEDLQLELIEAMSKNAL